MSAAVLLEVARDAGADRRRAEEAAALAARVEEIREYVTEATDVSAGRS